MNEIEILALLQRHWAPRGILVPGENGKIFHLPVTKSLNDGLRPLQVGNERDARVHRPPADVVSIGSAELVVFDGDVDHQVDELLLDGVHARHHPVFGVYGRSPRAATSRADGVSGRSTRRQAHWSAARIHSPPKMPAGTGAVAFRSVFAFIESPNLQQAAFAHFRGKRSLHYPGALGLREWVRVVLCWPLIFFLGSK